MKSKYVAAPALAFAFVSSVLVHPGMAQTKPSAPPPSSANPSTTPNAPTKAPEKADAEAQAIMKFSQDGHNAIREIGAARLAIFNGDPKTAMEMITEAKSSVTKAEQEAPTFNIKTITSVESKVLETNPETVKAEIVPVDGDVVLADNFVATPEKQAHIKKANEHFKRGATKEALEELRLGEIEVMYNRVWMPLAPTQKNLEEATKLMNEHKYYEANLALKAIGDSLTVDSTKLTEVPKKKG